MATTGEPGRTNKVPLVVGERYSIANITALVTVHFAAKEINLPEQHAALKRWSGVKNGKPLTSKPTYDWLQ